MTDLSSNTTWDHRGWRSASRLRRFISLPVRRIAATLLAAGLLLLFVVVLASPMRRPRTQLFVFEPPQYAASHAPVISSGRALAEAFSSFSDVLYRTEDQKGPILLRNLATVTQARSLQPDLARVLPAEIDVAIFYLAAHGVSQGNSAHLLCGDFDPMTNHLGRYPLADLLRQLRDCPAKLKLLVLDAGRIDHDPRLGVVLNEFPRLLEEEVHRAGDRGLWVLTSCQLLERSHVCHADQQSVFQKALVRGLQGAADADGDHEILLDELSRYVAASVSSWVREQTAGAESQTPRLIWGGGPGTLPETALTLLPVPRQVPTAQSAAQLATKTKAAPSPAAAAQKAVQTKSATRAENGKSASPTTPVAASQSAPAPPVAPQTAGQTSQGPSTAAAPADAAAPTATQSADKLPSATAPEAAVANAAPPPAAPSPTIALPTNIPDPAPPLPQPPASTNPAELLGYAWRLRDALESRAGGRPSPVDYAPHLWRQFQDRLLAYEAMRRASDSDESAQLSAMLRREMLPLPDLLASTAPVELDERATLAEQIACLKPSAPAGVSAPRSLAGAAALSWSSPELSAARIRDLAAQLEFWSASAPAREEYAKWVASLKPAERDLSELRWAAQIDALSELDWPTLQLALATRVAAERAVAAANGQRGWVDGLIADADARRLAGERRLLDSRGEVSSFAGAQRQLEAARSSYIQSIAHSELVKSVVQLRNELVFRAPSYVEWCGRGGLQESALGPARADVASLLATLSQLNDLLLAPDPANLGQLAKLQRQLTALRERVEVGLRGDLAGVLARSPATAGNVWRMELLLSTPLVDHDQRQRLAEAVVAAGVHKFDTRPDLSSVPPLLHVVAPQDLEKLFMRAELDVGLARLAGEPRSMDQAAGNGPQAAFDKLAAAQEQLRRESNPDLAGQPLWDAYRRFGSALGGLYRQLPAGINDALSSDYRLADQKTRADQLHTLARAEQQLRLLPGFAAPMPDRRSPLVSLRTAETYDELLWRRERLISAANDAPASEIAWLEQSAASYMHQATAIPGQPVPLESGGPAVALSGPSQLSLSDGSAHELLITLTNRRPAGVNAWVVLDYDPLLLEVVASPGHQVYRSDQLSSPNALLDRTPSATLRASADEAIPLRIIPKASAADRARLIVKVLTKEQIARHEIDLTLPGPAGIDLLVSGTPGTWQTTDSSLVLQPFPNTTTDYVLKLANRGPQSKRVRVDLMAAPLFDIAAGELDGAGPSGPILASAPELLLPSGGMPVAIEFPKPAAPATPAVPVLAPANQTAEGSGVPAPVDPRPVISRGFLLVITDPALNRSSVKRIDVAPLRPRSYLQPTVSYDPQRGRIDVLVRAKGRSQMPPGGSKVEWTAEEGMVGKMLLAGEVKSPDYTARLFAGVPSDPQRVVTVRLSADGFPRAFVFRVPCGAAQADVPVEEDLCQARIVSPSSGDVIRAPAATLPVALQVDMPVDAFQRAEDRIEVGIDVNLDRDLEGENTTVLRTDRQVQIRLNEAGPAGLLSLEAKVEDFQLDLDARGLQNARVGVLAKAVSSHTGWSPPVEVTLDGTAPRITSVDVSPAGLVTLGQPLKISMLAEDDEPSSGITRVELALDLNRTGEFDPEVKPVPAAAEPGGRWSAAIPTDKAPAGVHPLLIRAVDRAGHPSELSTVQVKIATTEDVKAQQLQATSRVTGIALHAGQPQPGMTVTLDDGKVPPVQTDDQGRFSFAAVPAGKHKVVAAGVIRNRTRRAEAEFTIEPATPQATALRLTLQ